ncbi:MAG: calcium-binding protein [Hyphomicrobium sp.]|nr:calcium-binding protein [Hyphomicrobium sp.]
MLYLFDPFNRVVARNATKYSFEDNVGSGEVAFVGTGFTYNVANNQLTGGTVTAIEFRSTFPFSELVQRVKLGAGVSVSALSASLFQPAANLNRQIESWGYQFPSTFIEDFLTPAFASSFTSTRVRIEDYSTGTFFEIHGSGFSITNGIVRGTVTSVREVSAGGSILHTATGVSGMSLNAALYAFGNGTALYSALIGGADTVTSTGKLYVEFTDRFFDEIFNEVSPGALVGGPGADTLTGTAAQNRDIADYSVGPLAGVTVNLLNSTASGGGGNDSLVNIDGIRGTAFADSLSGNNSGNFLNGGGGNDTLNGFGGNDGLAGGLGADRMTGGTGNDTFFVDAQGDVVIEANGAGSDEVRSIVSYTMAANVENLQFSYGQFNGNNINGTGNALNNKIVGSVGRNTISGGDGADTIDGALGDDILNGNTGNDRLFGFLGFDQLFGGDGNDFLDGGPIPQGIVTNDIRPDILDGGSGNDTLDGGYGNDTMTGGTGNDLIRPNNGDDVIDGGAGNDTMSGGAGLDSFRFSTALDASANTDRIMDFVVADDTIRLAKAVFATLGPTGQTIADAELSMTGSAVDGNTRIIYVAGTGELFYDSDGTGANAAVRFAMLSTNLSLTRADFLVV